MAAIKFFALILLLVAGGPALAALQIQHWETSKGARVYFVPAPELNIVDLQLVFDAGSARDGDTPGLALLTNAMLAEGAGNLDSDQIAEAFAAIGARFSNDSQRDMAVLTLRSLAEAPTLGPALDLFATVLTRPYFPAAALERERRRVLIGLQSRKQSPDKLADEAFQKAVFGNHPYATQPYGDEESVPRISAEQLRAFYARHYVARNAVLGIVGRLDRAQAEQLAERVFAGLPAGEAAPPLPAVAPLSQASDIQIAHPSAQTHILLGQPGMSRTDSDYFALYVGNHVLGGSGLVSRIMNEVREKRGLAYSSYSYFLPMRGQGPFIIGAQTGNNTADETLAVLRDTLQRFRSEGPTAEELSLAQKNITGGFALRIASNRRIVENIAMIGFYQLPLDYLDTFNANVEAVTIAAIKDAFQRRVDPERMITVRVGGG